MRLLSFRPILAGATALGASLAASQALAAGTPCEKLTKLTIPDVTIIAAAIRPAGPFSAPGMAKAAELPAFCRVEGAAHPTRDSDIKVEVWIPANGWNGKFQGVGNGGYMGNIPYDAMVGALKRGYAVASTDTGHAGDDLSLFAGHPEKVVDWAWRAIHLTAQTGKLIVRNNTGRFPDHAYFVGCSTGGHQALSEAQRFPADYDGIIAGDPGYDRVRQTAAYLYSWMALHDAAGAPLLSAADLKLVTRAAVAACDGLDGLKDGIIEDPRRCTFDPAALRCKPGASSGCLTQPQIDGVKKVYRGLRNPRTGEQLFPGWSIGSEGFGDAPAMGWGAFLVNPKTPMRSEVYTHIVFEDPNWDYRTFDFDRDVAYADAKIPQMAAVDHDLSAFKARGGKLLMYTGWADPVAAPMDVLKYYEGVQAKMGGPAQTEGFYRFFMAPGMGHCGNGPGPNTFDMLSELERWVEQGRPPERILASHSTNGVVDRTRPLCLYPRVARWTGRGSSDAAASFVCKLPGAKAGARK